MRSSPCRHRRLDDGRSRPTACRSSSSAPCGGRATARRWHEAHDSAGATTTGTTWALAEGEVGGPGHVETYILMANTSPWQGSATVTLLFEDGTTAHVSCAAGASAASTRRSAGFGAAPSGRRLRRHHRDRRAPPGADRRRARDVPDAGGVMGRGYQRAGHEATVASALLLTSAALGLTAALRPLLDAHGRPRPKWPGAALPHA